MFFLVICFLIRCYFFDFFLVFTHFYYFFLFIYWFSQIEIRILTIYHRIQVVFIFIISNRVKTAGEASKNENLPKDQRIKAKNVEKKVKRSNPMDPS